MKLWYPTYISGRQRLYPPAGPHQNRCINMAFSRLSALRFFLSLTSYSYCSRSLSLSNPHPTELTLVMMFNFLFTSSLLSITLLCARISSVDSLCLPCRSSLRAWYSAPLPRSVYNPKITNPTARTTWKAGSQVTITWCGCSGIIVGFSY